MLYTIVLSKREILNVLAKCDALREAMQSSVFYQHHGVVKIKFTKELKSRYATFVYCNHSSVVYEYHVSRRRDCKLR